MTSLASCLLLEEWRQLIGLRLGLGPICCDENYQFQWACEREYQGLINYYLKSDKKDEIRQKKMNGGQHVFEFSYKNKKFQTMKALIQHSNEIFGAQQVRRYYWDATMEMKKL